MFVLAILLTGMGMFVHTISSTSKLGPVNRETVLAMTAARGMAEQIRSEGAAGVFARYNQFPKDDPGGVGTAPGPNFPVPGLSLVPGDSDGMAGEIIFPANGKNLREDIVDPALGLPRDLNGDGVMDNVDHSTDYEILPYTIRIRWTGKTGVRTFELQTAVGQL
jgi:hypothetical protein